MERAVTHSLCLLCLTDDEDLTSKELSFSLGVGVCTQLKAPFTIHSTAADVLVPHDTVATRSYSLHR